jgi:hypothetical protein
MKKARADYKERIVAFRKSFEETMAIIDGCLRYYDNAEEQLSRQLEKEPLQFRYDPNMELEQINADLRLAVVTYRRMSDKNGDQGATAAAEMEASTVKASELLKQLTEVAASSALKVRQVFEAATKRAEQTTAKQPSQPTEKSPQPVKQLHQPPQPAKLQFGFSANLKNSVMLVSEGNAQIAYDGD